MTALEVHGLSVSFGEQVVLHNIDLQVESGITAVLGSSGCGKSTLLRTIAGFLDAREGEVLLAGRPMNLAGHPVPPRRRNIGYVPQEGALFPHLDVAANIAFGLPWSHRRDARERVREMLALVELPETLAQRFPHELSGGQQQRVALARALTPGPALVLLDEPFSSLDTGLREETGRAVIRALRAAGAAALLVTHDQGEALSLADQVAVMAKGRFLQVDSPLGIYLDPVDATVATFLGHASLVSAIVEPDGNTATCLLGRAQLRSEARPGRARLAIRPEQVQLHPSSSRSADPARHVGHGAEAEVVDVSFFGHDATVRIRVNGAADVLTARTPADGVPPIGERVWASVQGAVLCFAEDSGGPTLNDKQDDEGASR